MQSHCLNHQEKVATKRCISCLKPLCENCVQAYTEGVFCGDDCRTKSLATAERAATIAASDRQLAEWQQRQTAYKIITTVVVGFGLFFGWEHLPAVLTDNVEKLWAAIKGLFG